MYDEILNAATRLKEQVAALEAMHNQQQKADLADLLGEQMNAIRVGQNFWLYEFQCKGSNCGCNNAVKLDPELARRLQAMRTETGSPIIINSGYRCIVHNRAVGSTDTSQHPRGTAADIVIVRLSMSQQEAICEKYFPDGGIGRAKTFTHVDTRGFPARWRY